MDVLSNCEKDQSQHRELLRHLLEDNNIMDHHFLSTLEGKAQIRAYHNVDLGEERSISTQINAWFQEIISAYLEEKGLAISYDTFLPLVKSTIIFISLDHVYNKVHLQAGIIRALFCREIEEMITKNLETEIFYQLAPSTSINSAVKLFSINDTLPSNNLAMVQILLPSAEHSNELEEVGMRILQFVSQQLQRFEFSIDNMESLLLSPEKKERILKIFKFGKDEREEENIVGSILSRLAIKDHL